MVDTFAEPVEDLINSQEAAQIIGITVNNFRQLVHKKLIVVAYKQGRTVVFHRADVMRIVEDRAAKGLKTNASADSNG